MPWGNQQQRTQEEVAASENACYQAQQGQDPLQQGRVWQPWGLGGGEWKNPEVVKICEADIERIARAVVRMLKEQAP